MSPDLALPNPNTLSSDQLALVKVTGYHCKKPPTPFMTVGFPLFLPKCPPPGNFLNYINSMEKKKDKQNNYNNMIYFLLLIFFLSPLSHFVLTPSKLTFFIYDPPIYCHLVSCWCHSFCFYFFISIFLFSFLLYIFPTVFMEFI